MLGKVCGVVGVSGNDDCSAEQLVQSFVYIHFHTANYTHSGVGQRARN